MAGLKTKCQYHFLRTKTSKYKCQYVLLHAKLFLAQTYIDIIDNYNNCISHMSMYYATIYYKTVGQFIVLISFHICYMVTRTSISHY